MIVQLCMWTCIRVKLFVMLIMHTAKTVRTAKNVDNTFNFWFRILSMFVIKQNKDHMKKWLKSLIVM